MRSAMMGLARTALIVLALAGCSAGTRLTTSGTICGQPSSWPWLTERTVRGSRQQSRALTAAALTVSSTDSSTSQVLQAQAELATRLTALAEILARSVPMPPVSADGRGLELEQLAYTIEAEDGR